MIRILPLLLLLAGCASIPARYDYPYQGEMVVHMMSIQEVRAICGSDQAWACTILGFNVCSVYIYNRLGKKRTAKILKHEQAHCNGWLGTHPS